MMYRKNELYHYGVKGMRWGVRRDLRKTARTHTKTIRKHQKEAAKNIGIANNKSEYEKYYNKKYQKAVKKGKVEKADKFKKRSEHYRNEVNEANKKYKASRESIEKAKDLVSKNSDLMITYKRGHVYAGNTLDGGTYRVDYSKAKVLANTETNRKLFANNQIEKGYNFIKEYYYYA